MEALCNRSIFLEFGNNKPAWYSIQAGLLLPKDVLQMVCFWLYRACIKLCLSTLLFSQNYTRVARVAYIIAVSVLKRDAPSLRWFILFDAKSTPAYRIGCTICECWRSWETLCKGTGRCYYAKNCDKNDQCSNWECPTIEGEFTRSHRRFLS